MIISGKNSVYEALNSNKTINKVLISKNAHDTFFKNIIDMCKQNKVRFDFVDKKVLDNLSQHNQGLVAEVTDFKYSTVEEILQNRNEKGNFIVLLDGVQDPHNFGSIIRVCECAGVDGIVIESRHSCNVNETVFKTSCGAINYVKIAKVTNLNDVIKQLKNNNVWVFAADMDGDNLTKTNLTGNIAIVLGGEGQGVSKLTKQLCDGVISLPMYGKVNSLNVSTATSAVVYEVLRQRNLNGN